MMAEVLVTPKEAISMSNYSQNGNRSKAAEVSITAAGPMDLILNSDGSQNAGVSAIVT